ncbi:MAG: hypothetical protein IPG75_10120 [Gemmatimonadetes bacterium]|nr:hypothetical protein [Gemmatimonadota bacterium]
MSEFLFPRSPYSLALQRPASEVVAHLEKAIASSSAWDFLRPRLVGRFEGPVIILRRASPWDKDAGLVQFRGHVSADGRRLEGWFEPTVFTRIFAVFWLGVLVLMFMPVLLAQTTREGLTPDNLLLWLVMIAFVAVGFLFPWLSLKTSTADRTAVVSVLTTAAGSPAA